MTRLRWFARLAAAIAVASTGAATWLSVSSPGAMRDQMAERRTNAGIAGRLWPSEKTIQAHVRSILGKIDLPISSDDHRRVLAVLAYLRDGRGIADE